MIEVQNLTKRFGTHTAVSGVSFEAKKGEILGFLGPNGAGKTTTMRILTCYLPATEGQATVAGYDVQDQSIEVRRRIGYLPENVPLYRDMPVNTYLDFVGKLKGMSRSERRHRIAAIMSECGIEHVQHRIIGRLSRGYRQRVGLAQAMINDPEVLVLDEPTVGLDPQQIIEIRELIRNLAGRRTIILSTHILPEVSLLCHRVIIINKGQLITVDTPDNLKRRLQQAITVEITVRGPKEQFEQSLDDITDIRSIEHVESREGSIHRFRLESIDKADIRETVARRIVEDGFGLIEMNTRDMSLEDIFVELVTKEDAS